MAFGSNEHRSAASPAAILAAVMAVAGCAAQPPAPPPAVATVIPAERPAPPRPAAPLPKPVDLHWAFTTTGSTCTALASGPGGSLQLLADSSRQLTVTARFTQSARAIPLNARPARLIFRGPAGTWSLAGTWQNRAFSNKQHLDEHGVANILGLLGGGTAIVSAGPLNLGTARLPAANTEGSSWVQCPKTLSGS